MKILKISNLFELIKDLIKGCDLVFFDISIQFGFISFKNDDG